MTRESELDTTAAGAGFALAAFLLWGVFPIYFKAVAAAPVLEILAHRVVWSVVFVAILISAAGRWRAVARVLKNRRLFLTLVASSLLVSTNWLIFIWAITHGFVLESSLGYYITPLVSVFLGVVVLGERLRTVQWAAVALAAVAVAVMIARFGYLPWIGLTLAFTFGAYGMIRKVAKADALTGLFMETLILAPMALAYILYLDGTGNANFIRGGWQLSGLLVLAGVVTALPLILFAAAAKRLRLSTLGLFQYITPTSHFLLAVLVFGETLTAAHGVAFGGIWMALILYSGDSLRHRQRPEMAPKSIG